MIDIVNRLRFDAIRCEAQFSKGVAGNITEAADEIERLRGELDRSRGLLTLVLHTEGIPGGGQALTPRKSS